MLAARSTGLLALLLAPSPLAWAQMVAPPPTLRAHRTLTPPVLDGHVLDDPAWQAAPRAGAFTQASPDEGLPSSETTEVRVMYDDATLYVGVFCRTRDGALLVSTDGRRDAALDNSDAFLMVIDTFLDRQNGFVFGTNPAGMEYDGQVSNEGQQSSSGFGMGGRTQVGSGGGFNLNWDGDWQVRTHVDPLGWSAEFAIPFRTLRYAGIGVQTWGLNFQRTIRHRNELSYWAPLPRQFQLQRVSAAGVLTNVEIGAQRNLKLVPYVLREALLDVSRVDGWRWRQQGGVDLKYSLTPSLTVDGTVGTDFSQVEVDEQQLNLTRFPVLFPEKRPFFLENAGFFSAGHPGQIDLFFSRRIGIGPAGQVIPIVGGARLSGKVGRLNLGLLDMQSAPVEGVAVGNNFGVVRLAHELPNRSSVGLLFVNRQATSGADADRDHNRTYAVDGRVGLGRYALVSGFVAKTHTPGVDDQEHAYEGAAIYDSPHWVIDAKLARVAENFNPEVGFLLRKNYFNPEAGILYRFRPNNFLGFYEIRPHARFYSFLKPDGFEESRFIHLDNHWQWRNGYELHTGVNLRREGLATPFEIYPGVIIDPGTYDHTEAQFTFNSNLGAPIGVSMTLTAGGFYNGSQVALRPRVVARLGGVLSADVFWDRTYVDLPAGRFNSDLAVGRLSYSISNRMFVQGLLQYAERFGILASNLRFGWLQSGGAGFFLVYTETLNTGAGVARLAPIQRSIVAKLSLMFDVL